MSTFVPDLALALAVAGPTALFLLAGVAAHLSTAPVRVPARVRRRR